MLGDVEVDWSLPEGYGIRSVHQTEGRTDDLLVCIPLPGVGRCRMSILAPDELATEAACGVHHGIEGGRTPNLQHIQAVLDRLAPEPTKAHQGRPAHPSRRRARRSYRLGQLRMAGVDCAGRKRGVECACWV